MSLLKFLLISCAGLLILSGCDEAISSAGSDGVFGFDAQYIRTNGYVDGAKYPTATKISSIDELERYFEEYKDIYDFSSRSPDGLGFVDAIEKYTEDFFKDRLLAVVLLEEGSGSVRHEVESVLENGDIIINRITPEVGTDDMAEWHIIIEIDGLTAPEKFEIIFKNNAL